MIGGGEDNYDYDYDDNDTGRKLCWVWVTWKFVVNALISILFLITNNIIIIIDINASPSRTVSVM